jgi:hypothetical protein
VRTQVIAACLALSLTGCATPSAVQMRPPAEAAALCRELPEPADDSVNAVVIAYADTIDAYADCATRHKALSEWTKR